MALGSNVRLVMAGQEDHCAASIDYGLFYRPSHEQNGTAAGRKHWLERQEALRSKKAEGVRQEIWGILLAYNLVRGEMTEVAEAAGVSPLRISIRHALMLIRIFCMAEAWTCAQGNLPKRLASRHDTLSSLLILPQRRPHRGYKRHVKIKMSGYKRSPGKPVAKGAE